jgi:hypothetical protein
MKRMGTVNNPWKMRTMDNACFIIASCREAGTLYCGVAWCLKGKIK